MSILRQTRAVLLLPFAVTIVVPALIVAWTGDVRFWWGSVSGVALLAIGLVLVVWTIRLFSRRATAPSRRGIRRGCSWCSARTGTSATR